MDISEIKLKAAEVNTSYNPDSLVPFPFEDMARSLGNVRILYLSTDQNISGAIYFTNDEFTIVINSDKPEVRQYFTLAHEFGHYFLHQEWLQQNSEHAFVDFSYSLDSGNMLLRPDDLNETPVNIPREREANNFAAELIMPADKVKELWKLTHSIQDCSDAFKVSTTAMAARLDRLSLT